MKIMLSKALVFAVIVLFIGAGFVPNIDDYLTVQEAIDNAKHGDTIQVRAGYYKENIVIDKSIDLIGENKFDTTIDGSHIGDVINVLADNVTIRGLDIRRSGTEHWKDAGIELNADFITISNNIIQYNYYAIWINDSSDNIISQNIINENSYGGIMYYYHPNSNNNTINKNIIEYNRFYGILVDSSNNNIISDNYIYQSSQGIVLSDSGNNNLFNNNIIECNLGFWLINSIHNTIYHNNFINNEENAADDSQLDVDNFYYNDKFNEGNYWDDYNGSDSDGDGIGDTPYDIQGSSEAQDLYPLMELWNQAPNKPSKPSGPTSGKAGKEYTYSTSTTDPDGDQVYYKWYWNDKINETSGWLGPYDSGDTVTASHIWEEKGDYNIRVKAKDVHGEESPWSDPLPITMPKNKAINPFIQFLERLIERFPILEQILQLIYVYLG